MEDYYSSPLCSTYLYQDEGIEELRHSVLYITELEATIDATKEQIKRREMEIHNLKQIITKTFKERNEAQEESKKLFLENVILQEQESEEDESEIVVMKIGELPKKGKLLEAVKEAGPLLHTLLLSGHLPQWQHPPPPLPSIDFIPPPSFTFKRPLDTSFSTPPSNKYQKVSLL